MELKFFDESGQSIEGKPVDGSWYREETWVNGKRLAVVECYSLTQEQRTQQKVEEEKAWRNQELAYIDSQSYGESFPYFTQVEDYKQALRDYPMQLDFPYGKRPSRPVNENGNLIIT